MSKKIGIVGKLGLTNAERSKLEYIGSCLAKQGHQMVFSQNEGTAQAVLSGFSREHGETVMVANNVIDTADFTIAYVNKTFLKIAEKAYPDFLDRPDVAVGWPEDLDGWVKVMQEIVIQRNT